MPHLESSSVGEPLCTWTDSSRNFAIRVRSSVIEDLGKDSGAAFKTRPRQEIAGILLGRTECRDNTTTFWIEGFQPVELGHEIGPSYVLSEFDFIRVQEAVTRNGAASLGVYRSQTSPKRLAVREADVKIFERCFAKKDALFLVLGQLPLTAGFFVRVNGKLKSVHEFAMVSSLDSDHQRVSGPHLNLRLRSGLRNWHVNALVVAVVLLLAINVLALFRGHAAPPGRVSAAPLRLTVEPPGPPIRISWDQNDAVIRGAARAVLHIEDGPLRLDKELKPEELRTGRIRYEPRTSQVSFQLDVYSEAPNATGLLHVMTAVTLPILPRDPHREKQVKPAIPTHAAEESVNLLASSPTGNQSRRLSPTHLPSKPGQVPVTAAPNQPSSRNPVPSLADATKHEEIQASAYQGFNGIDVRSSAPDLARLTVEIPAQEPPTHAEAPIAPSGREPSVRVLAEPVMGSRLGHLVGKIPALRTLRQQVKTVPPIPLEKIQPSVKLTDKDGLARPVSVEVKVYVGETGIVKHAEVTDYGDPPNWSLAKAALAAGKLWTFEPARIEDIPVSSEVVLHFRFTP